MGNPFVHVELMATDVGKAKSFYGELFDWKLKTCRWRDDLHRHQGRRRHRRRPDEKSYPQRTIDVLAWQPSSAAISSSRASEEHRRGWSFRLLHLELKRGA